MTVTLDRADLIHLIKGTTPSHAAQQYADVRACGRATGGMGGESWQWSHTFSAHLSDDHLWRMYQAIKRDALSMP